LNSLKKKGGKQGKGLERKKGDREDKRGNRARKSEEERGRENKDEA